MDINFSQIINLLRADGSIVVNKSLARNLGLNCAALYSELVSSYKYYLSKGELKLGGWFYCTIDKLEYNTGLSKHEQETAIKKLIEKGLIIKDIKKLAGDGSGKRYFKIVEDINLILSFLKDKTVDITGLSEKGNSSSDNREPEIPKTETNNNNINNKEDEERTREDNPLDDYINEICAAVDLNETEAQDVKGDVVKSIKNIEAKGERVLDYLKLSDTCLNTYIKSKKINNSLFMKNFQAKAPELNKTWEKRQSKYKPKFEGQRKLDFDEIAKKLIP